MNNKKPDSADAEEDFANAVTLACQRADERRKAELQNNDTNADDLLKACREGDVEQVKSLLESGANPNAVTTYGTALCRAMTFPWSSEIVKLLIGAAADPNLPDKEGLTPLFCAAGNDRADIIQLLIEAGAHVNTQCFANSWTALMNAASFGHINSVIELLASGADISLQSSDRLTAMDIANGNRRKLVVQVLKKYIEILTLRP